MVKDAKCGLGRLIDLARAELMAVAKCAWARLVMIAVVGRPDSPRSIAA